jgi:hypothetical protein
MRANRLWSPTQTSDMMTPSAQLEHKVRSAMSRRTNNKDIEGLFIGHCVLLKENCEFAR